MFLLHPGLLLGCTPTSMSLLGSLVRGLLLLSLLDTLEDVPIYLLWHLGVSKEYNKQDRTAGQTLL